MTGARQAIGADGRLLRLWRSNAFINDCSVNLNLISAMSLHKVV